MDTNQAVTTVAVLNSEAGKELTHRAGEIFSKLVGPLSEQLGLILGDQFAFYRLKRSVALCEKAEKFLRGKKVAHHLNPGRILPIIQTASMESDEDLHSRWAALLANELHEPSSVHPSYIEILKQLTSDEARWLDRAFDETMADEEAEQEALHRQNPGHLGDFYVKCQIRDNTFEEANDVMLGNLERLGLVRGMRDELPESVFVPAINAHQIYVSPLGRASRDPTSAHSR